MTTRRTVSIATLALCAALAVGCGGDDDETGVTTPAVATDPADDPDATSIVTEATTEATPATTAATTAATAAPAATTAPAASTTAARPAAPDATEAAGGEDAAGGTEFTIAEFAFPDDFVAKAGEEFTVRNDDEFAHTVTSSDFDVELDGEASKPLTIDAAGTYDIVCTIHPQMTGTITVE